MSGAWGVGIDISGAPGQDHNPLCLLSPGLMGVWPRCDGGCSGPGEVVSHAINGAKFLKRHMFDVASGRLMRTCYAGAGGTVEHR